MASWPYSTRRWERLRRAKLNRDPLCEYCPPGRVTAATQVDHKRAIEAGGDAWAWENLASSCAGCHSRKTAGMDGGFGRARRETMPADGCDADGVPLDPAHPWAAEARGGEGGKSLGAAAADRPGESHVELVSRRWA